MNIANIKKHQLKEHAFTSRSANAKILSIEVGMTTPKKQYHLINN
ncbi:hypothetical protein IMCC3135_22115 [Granulosicoccus antarcticus IMCC3135]|uniref:Uncharacterized protein n=1 Tax=Granulosicoccus antarcticus IMCC3135 TaxID=1192854 RepID=A0A2Z2P3U4_9GAMM|nr:hypothetical protein IMCC3135_22115 [Granulosicoccus antarcticus IMCC3135]